MKAISILGAAFILIGRLSAGVINGGFESDFSGWTAAGNVTVKSTPPYLASEGTKLAVFNSVNSTPNGSLQTVATVLRGHHYLLQFDAGNLSYNSQSQRIRVTVDDANGFRLVDDHLEIAGPGGGATAWQTGSYEITPSYTTLKLGFADASAATNSLDLVLDNVRLTDLTPTGNLLANGSFESGLDGWNPDGNVSGQSAPPYLATEGSRLISFNAGNSAPNGSIRRFVPLVSEERYRLTFDVGNLSYNSSHQRLRVLVNYSFSYHFAGTSVDEIIDVTGPGGGATAWVSASYEFIAPIGVNVQFFDVSQATNSVDLVLDNVKLVSLGPASRAQFVNGGFESGMEGWTVSTSPAGAVAKSTAPYAPTDGDKLAAFNSVNTPTHGSIRQTIDTLPGQVYQLIFSVGNLSYNSQPQRLRVLIDDGGGFRIRDAAIVIPSNSSSGGTNWLPWELIQFSAISGKTTFTFIDASDFTNGTDLVLDRVYLGP